jgi:DNA-binding LacI/PurR family transcriptional regulator
VNDLSQKTSMQDIATALGISKNAVSLALNNKPGISESLRQKVIDCAISMNYGSYGKLESSRNKRVVAICVPSAISGFSQFYSSIYWTVERELASRGYRSLLTSVSSEMEDSLQLPPVLTESDVLGVIVVGTFAESYIVKISSVFKNLVLVDSHFVNLQINSVSLLYNCQPRTISNKFLIEKGFKRIGFLGDVFRAYKERFLGYQITALEESGSI